MGWQSTDYQLREKNKIKVYVWMTYPVSHLF
jgi:hypothetical protein